MSGSMSKARKSTGSRRTGPPQLSYEFASVLPELTRPSRTRQVNNPRLLILNEPLAEQLGLDPKWLRTEEGLEFMLGTSLPDDALPVAQAYAGHQFGTYSPILGDGRAILLGELTTPEGELVDLHLKGSGLTDFSRPGSDGLAAVGPMLREYVISEALHGLGIPTTRSLAVIATDDPVHRETVQQAAILVRVASSHLRVGSFQLAAHHRDTDLLRRLVDYSLQRHYPDAEIPEDAAPAAVLLENVVKRQADLVAHWMTAGFIHGVMNTDNMTISGESIDFGPCAFLNEFDPQAVFSSIDHQGRYAYENQPIIAEWNLARFAEALLPAIRQPSESAPEVGQKEAIELATGILAGFRDAYSQRWVELMVAKLGLGEVDFSEVGEEARTLAAELPALVGKHRLDHHDFYFVELVRWAEQFRDEEAAEALVFSDGQAVPEDLGQWLHRWLALNPNPEQIRAQSPRYPVRNHQVEEVLAAAESGDIAPVKQLSRILAKPFESHEKDAVATTPVPADADSYRTFCGT